ncbi:MAG: metallophosphoesterase [Bradyrhizobium sp.]|nr:metallophosphoesterase [Bradyrhizobium sp.]
MAEFRLTQISDTHLARRLTKLTVNFERVAGHIDSTRPDLVLNSGDIGFDGPNAPEDLEFARSLHDALPVPCRYLPGNHDVGDNPTQVGPTPAELVSERARQAYISVFGDDRWRFDAAGWCFIGLNSLVMNSGLVCEAEQFDWLAGELANIRGRPVALFLHKPVFLNAPDDPELAVTSFRYVPMPTRRRLLEMLRTADIRLIASGHVHQRRDFTFGHTRHVWSPSAGFMISDARQERIGIKETGLVEYRFQPDAFEVRHVRAPGQVNVDLDELLVKPTPEKAPAI